MWDKGRKEGSQVRGGGGGGGGEELQWGAATLRDVLHLSPQKQREGSRTQAARRRTNGESQNQTAHPHAGRQTERGAGGERRGDRNPRSG